MTEINIQKYILKIERSSSISTNGIYIHFYNFEKTRIKSIFVGIDKHALIFNRCESHMAVSYKNQLVFKSNNDCCLLNNNNHVSKEVSNDFDIHHESFDNFKIRIAFCNIDFSNSIYVIIDKNGVTNTPLEINIYNFDIIIKVDTISRGIIEKTLNEKYIDACINTKKMIGRYKYCIPDHVNDEEKYVANVINMIGIKYLSREDDGKLYGHFEMPVYDGEMFRSTQNMLPVDDFNHYFDFIQNNGYYKVFNITKYDGGKPYISLDIYTAQDIIKTVLNMLNIEYLIKDKFDIWHISKPDKNGFVPYVPIGALPSCTVYKV